MTDANPTELFDFADQLGLISGEILRYRIRMKNTLSPDEKSQLEALEIQLDQSAAKVRAQGIAALSALTEPAQLELATATQEAEAALRDIQEVGRAVNISGSVLNLALATLTGKPKSILSAIKDVRHAIRAENT